MNSIENFRKILQIGTIVSTRLCRIKTNLETNIFTAYLLNNSDELSETDIEIRLINIAQDPQEESQLSLPIDSLCFEINGKFYTYISESEPTPAMLGKVSSSLSSAKYQITKLNINGAGEFLDSTDIITATNLAEIGIGPGNAIDLDTKVVIQKVIPEDSHIAQYFFSHNPFAKYLD